MRVAFYAMMSAVEVLVGAARGSPGLLIVLLLIAAVIWLIVRRGRRPPGGPRS